MAFVIGKIQTVKRRVVFTQLADDGKPAKKADFVVEFTVRDADTVKARRRELQDYLTTISKELSLANKNPEYEAQIPEGNQDETYVREDVVNIEGILTESGDEVPYSLDVLEEIMKDRIARKALITTWSELNLEDGAKRKN